MIQKTKLNINKLLEVENFYIPKDLFNYDLSVPEIRLLIILSTRQADTDGSDFTVDSLSRDLKHFIDHKNYSKIPSYAERLKELDLINSNGVGKKLDNGYVIFSEFPTFKNIRQLFLLCCKDNKWHTKGNIFITVDMFKNLFGESKTSINQYWKRTNEQLGTDFSFKPEKGNITIRDNKKPKKAEVEKEEVKQEKKANREFVDKMREEFKTPKMDSWNSSKIDAPDCDAPSEEEQEFGTGFEECTKVASMKDILIEMANIDKGDE